MMLVNAKIPFYDCEHPSTAYDVKNKNLESKLYLGFGLEEGTIVFVDINSVQTVYSRFSVKN
jgi:hypothetical protein